MEGGTGNGREREGDTLYIIYRERREGQGKEAEAPSGNGRGRGEGLRAHALSTERLKTGRCMGGVGGDMAHKKEIARIEMGSWRRTNLQQAGNIPPTDLRYTASWHTIHSQWRWILRPPVVNIVIGGRKGEV